MRTQSWVGILDLAEDRGYRDEYDKNTMSEILQKLIVVIFKKKLGQHRSIRGKHENRDFLILSKLQKL